MSDPIVDRIVKKLYEDVETNEMIDERDVANAEGQARAEALRRARGEQ